MYQLHARNPVLPSGYSTNRRPHYYPGGGTFNISFRLKGSITRKTFYEIQRLHKLHGGDIPAEVYWSVGAEERVGFRQMSQGILDRRTLNGPFYLHHDPVCREILAEAFAYREGTEYETLAYSIMPNHVHWVVRHTSRRWHMGQLLANLKRFVARQSNLHLGRTGSGYFEKESWDRCIRDQRELLNSVRYTIQNPVVCRMAGTWNEWPGNYLHSGFRELPN